MRDGLDKLSLLRGGTGFGDDLSDEEIDLDGDDFEDADLDDVDLGMISRMMRIRKPILRMTTWMTEIWKPLSRMTIWMTEIWKPISRMTIWMTRTWKPMSRMSLPTMMTSMTTRTIWTAGG